MWKNANLIAATGSIILISGWWRVIRYATSTSQGNSVWSFVAISAATLVAYIGVRFMEAARADSQSTPRQFLDQKLITEGTWWSLGAAALLVYLRSRH